MDIRTACARVGSTNSTPNIVSDEVTVIAAALAKEAAEVAKIAGVTRHEVHYESIGIHDGQQHKEGPCLADIAPKCFKSKEHRHYYAVGQQSSYYAALIAEQQVGNQQPLLPKSPTPAMLLQRVLMQHVQSPPGEPGSARSSSSSSSTHKPSIEQQEEC